jgi:hypothetical protein
MIRLPTPYPTRRFDNEEIFQVDKALEVPSGADDGDASHAERLAVTARQDETRPLALDENLFGQERAHIAETGRMTVRMPPGDIALLLLTTGGECCYLWQHEGATAPKIAYRDQRKCLL